MAKSLDSDDSVDEAFIFFYLIEELWIIKLNFISSLLK